MKDQTNSSLLRLVDDPVIRTMQMLRRMPLPTMVIYLNKISRLADHQGLLSDEDRERIGELIQSIPHPGIDKAA